VPPGYRPPPANLLRTLRPPPAAGPYRHRQSWWLFRWHPQCQHPQYQRRRHLRALLPPAHRPVALSLALALLLSLALTVTPQATRAQSTPAAAALARIAADQLIAARGALEAASTARDRVRALTATVKAYEAGLEAMRDGLRRAAIRDTAIEQEFAAENARLSELLAVLMTIEAQPDGLSLLHPDGPLGTARAAMMLADVTPAFMGEVSALQGRLQELAQLRQLQQQSLQQLAEGLTGAQQARTALSQAISERTDLPRRFLSRPGQLEQVVSSTDTLENFARSLAILDEANAVDPLPDLAAARGTLPLPVRGRLLRRFDEPDAAGIRRPGLLIASRPRALVTVPWPATLRFAGPLLDYGNVVILEPGNDVLLVLAGLQQLYGRVGEVLPAGTAVGLMGGSPPTSDGILSASGDQTGSARTETLYIEIRQGGRAIDPAPWFAIEKE
jgi:murein hydrolase activator